MCIKFNASYILQSLNHNIYIFYMFYNLNFIFLKIGILDLYPSHLMILHIKKHKKSALYKALNISIMVERRGFEPKALFKG